MTEYRSNARIITKDIPKIVCLIGSTKFKREFIQTNFEETMKGNIVLTVGWFSHTDGHIFTPSEKEKLMLDELHKRKIDLSDEVIVINVGGYIGDSTRSEIDYARNHGKPILFMSKMPRFDIRRNVKAEHYYGESEKHA